jgi:signal transduction histidine kinase
MGRSEKLGHMSRDEMLYLSLLVFETFAACTLWHLVYLQYRQRKLGTPVWGGWMWRALTLVFAITFLRRLVDMLAFVISDARITEDPVFTHLAHTLARPLAGPLLMHIYYSAERERLPRPRVWKALVIAAYAIAVPDALVFGVSVLGKHCNLAWGERLNDIARAVSDGVMAIAAIFTIAAMYTGLRSLDTAFRRRQWHWYMGLAGVFLSLLVVQQYWWGPWLDAYFGSTLTLAVVVVTVYYGERLAFFDLFVKRALLFLLSFTVLTTHALLVAPYLRMQRMAFVAPVMYALALLPLILVTPWTYAQLNAWVDRHWLGRRFAPADAVNVLSEQMQGAIDEPDLIERAEAGLGAIYQSRACVDLDEAGSGALTPSAGEIRASVKVFDEKGVARGTIRVFPRPDGLPFLSEDADLLRVLAHTLGSLFESQHLRDERLGQQQRERELVFRAAQSELKALRARINPHFLFNALNTIAALIPSRPAQAEETVERLAEVFRYTVHRAEREWVSVGEEIEFVRSYLEIERVRFDGRLRVEIRVDQAAFSARIPAMTIQTLAENAIKHGIAAVRGPGRVAISAEVRDGVLSVGVEDNGPGFETIPDLTSDGLATPDDSPTHGYGLINVQARLRAHYGETARLRFDRDGAAGATVVSFEIPAVPDAAGGAICAS